MFFSAGGTTVKVWDALGTGLLIASMSSFQKTVTCLAMAPVAGPDTDAAMRLLAGSLDGHVRVRLFTIPAHPPNHPKQHSTDKV